MKNRNRIGIDLGGTKIEVAVIDGDDRFLLRERVDTPQGRYDETVAAIAALIARARDTFGADTPAGIGMPGSLDEHGLIQNANSTVLIGRPLLDDISAATGTPVRGENDANCLARSEANGGAATDASVAFAVILGTGVGGSAAVNGVPIDGAHRIAGEWGHNPLPWPTDEERPGRLCYCGKHGCIETWLSGPALSADYERATGECKRAIEIVASVHDDAAAAAALERYVDRLARGLATIANVLDPQCFVLGGGMSNVSQLYQELPERVGRYVFTKNYRLDLRPAAFGDSSGVRGAAMLAGATREPARPH